jgi:HAT1-interacting factor 1
MTRLPTLSGPAGATDEDPLGGILGSILGESASEQKARIEQATKSANDISGLVKKKKAPEPAAPVAGEVNGKGKRKLEEALEGENGVDSKKARVEDAEIS